MIASATFKDGEMAGMPVPLHCTWYNISGDTQEFVQIPDVSGSCFQPSVEDIGLKIAVHAIPASDIQEYQGMPLFTEVGPLVLDPAISDQVQHFSKQNPIVFPRITLDSVQHPKL